MYHIISSHKVIKLEITNKRKICQHMKFKNYKLLKQQKEIKKDLFKNDKLKWKHGMQNLIEHN